MNTCSTCHKKKELNYFIKGEKTLKTCKDCRNSSYEYKRENKERTKKYNEMYRNNKKNSKDIQQVIYARKKGAEEWINFKNLTDASNKLGLWKSNICKVIKQNINTTGDYEFKIIEEEFKIIEVKTWDEIKKENNFGHKQKGKPSPHRINHIKKQNINGKICCCCKKWVPLTEYNYSKNHWDKLRNDCKICLSTWRKNNRESINKKHKIYEKNRKLYDPEFKLIKTLRTRLGTVLRTKNIKKNTKTLDLIGCSPAFLINYLEEKFTEGMSWENHGTWHIDHRKPCAKFDLTKKEEQEKCFHYTNLQPLWAKDNLSKGSKYDDNLLNES